MVKDLMELIVTRLCGSVSFLPAAIGLQCETVLLLVGKEDPVRCLRLLLPFACGSNLPTSAVDSTSKGKSLSSNSHLLTLHVLAGIIKHLTSAQLISEVATMVPCVLPAVSSAVLDLRQAAVLLLVEAYLVIGDALYPYLVDLTAPQKKLLTIYIEKSSNSKPLPNQLSTTLS